MREVLDATIMPRQLYGDEGGRGNVRKGRKWSKMEEKGRRQVRKWKGEGKEQKAHCQPTSHPVDPIFFKRPAHSSRPDSLTIIKRKSFYSAVSFRCSALIFLPPTSASTSSPSSLPSLSSSLADIVRPSSSSPPFQRLFYYPITLICLAKGTKHRGPLVKGTSAKR